MLNDPIIITLSGKKGGGKNTLASFILDHYPSVAKFGGRGVSTGELAFADGIKDFCIDILGLDPIQCYGSDEDKNTPTKYKWEDTPQFHLGWDRSEYMTGRDVMQKFGTECVRNWFGNVWAEATIRKIKKESLGFAVITDNRFPNEVETILSQPKGYVVRLTRSPFDGSDSHPSEVALDDFDWNRPNCFVLDNAKMDKKEQNDAMVLILHDILDGDLRDG